MLQYNIIKTSDIKNLKKAPLFNTNIVDIPTYKIYGFIFDNNFVNDNDFHHTEIAFQEDHDLYDNYNDNKIVFNDTNYSLHHLFCICLIKKMDLPDEDLLKLAIKQSKNIPLDFAYELYNNKKVLFPELVVKALYLTMAIKNNINNKIDMSLFILPETLEEALNYVDSKLKSITTSITSNI